MIVKDHFLHRVKLTPLSVARFKAYMKTEFIVDLPFG